MFYSGVNSLSRLKVNYQIFNIDGFDLGWGQLKVNSIVDKIVPESLVLELTCILFGLT